MPPVVDPAGNAVEKMCRFLSIALRELFEVGDKPKSMVGSGVGSLCLPLGAPHAVEITSGARRVKLCMSGLNSNSAMSPDSLSGRNSTYRAVQIGSGSNREYRAMADESTKG